MHAYTHAHTCTHLCGGVGQVCAEGCNAHLLTRLTSQGQGQKGQGDGVGAAGAGAGAGAAHTCHTAQATQSTRGLTRSGSPTRPPLPYTHPSAALDTRPLQAPPPPQVKSDLALTTPMYTPPPVPQPSVGMTVTTVSTAVPSLHSPNCRVKHSPASLCTNCGIPSVFHAAKILDETDFLGGMLGRMHHLHSPPPPPTHDPPPPPPNPTHTFFFMRTYVWLSLRSPTITTARPGTCVCTCVHERTCVHGGKLKGGAVAGGEDRSLGAQRPPPLCRRHEVNAGF